MLYLNQILFIFICNLILTFNTNYSVASQIIPCKQIKLLVPWGAGGGTDIIMRMIVYHCSLGCRWWNRYNFPSNC